MTIEEVLIYGGVGVWSAIVAYFILKNLPYSKGKTMPDETSHHHVLQTHEEQPSPQGVFDPSQGFRSFQQGKELTVEDIVKGLSRD